MAKYCCICGEKIGLMQGTPMFNGEICLSCSAKIGYLTNTHRGDPQERQHAYSYFETILSGDAVAPEVREGLSNALKSYNNSLKSYRYEVERSQKRKEESVSNANAAPDNKHFLLDNCLITGGFGFDGYKIIKYCGLVSGESVIGTGLFSELDADLADTFGVESSAFSSKLASAKRFAQDRLIDRVVEVGGNAVISVDYDYLTIGRNMLGVSANGTAVKVKPIVE